MPEIKETTEEVLYNNLQSSQNQLTLLNLVVDDFPQTLINEEQKKQLQTISARAKQLCRLLHHYRSEMSK